jgi:thioredoxin-related protein
MFRNLQSPENPLVRALNARPGHDNARRGLVAAMVGSLACAALAMPLAALAQVSPLERPASLNPLLERAARLGQPIVVMFSTAGCAWCNRLRTEHMRGLAAEALSRSIQVVEFDLKDDQAFVPAERPAGGSLAGVRSPLALAAQLKVRFAPTVVFLGPDGEIAERIVGYGSPDFYSAYLDDRIRQARARIAKAG